MVGCTFDFLDKVFFWNTLVYTQIIYCTRTDIWLYKTFLSLWQAEKWWQGGKRKFLFSELIQGWQQTSRNSLNIGNFKDSVKKKMTVLAKQFCKVVWNMQIYISLSLKFKIIGLLQNEDVWMINSEGCFKAVTKYWLCCP